MDLLPPKLLELLRKALDRQTLPPTSMQTKIILPLKADREPTLCGSYRPLSMINIDNKIYAEVLAHRINHLMQVLIHPDQSGFIPVRSTAMNLRRLLQVQGGADINSEAVVISLEAKKAFDYSLAWSFLFATLRNFGFGESFFACIKLLYTNPTARVMINDVCSRPFQLHRGTRQGCPRSPLFFALGIEPLAAQLR